MASNITDDEQIVTYGVVKSTSKTTAQLLEGAEVAHNSKSAIKNIEGMSSSGSEIDESVTNIKRASYFGFNHSNDGEQNTLAMNNALAGGGTIYIDKKGTYDIDGSMIVHDNTEIIFSEGVYIRRTSQDGYVFINEGAFTKTYNSNITIKGLRLICNGYESITNTIFGLNSHVGFFYVKNLALKSFECLDVLAKNYFTQVCTFENLTIDTFRVEGYKDAIHLGRGSKFRISNGIFKTFDDPIALNGHDYATATPELGWIEDGIIENCYDLNDVSTTGYFCRILAGAWVDWFSGMEIQNYDTVVSNGRMYRAYNSPDGTLYTSLTQPIHTSGTVTHEGINWVMTQEDIVYTAGVKNLTCRDIFLKKNRPTAFSIQFDNDVWSRGYYPNAESPIQKDFIFENISIDENVTVSNIIRSNTPSSNIKIVNSILGNNTKIDIGYIDTTGLNYIDTKILLQGCTLKGVEPQTLVACNANLTATFKAIGTIVENDNYGAWFSTGVSVTKDF